MTMKPQTSKDAADKVVKNIRRRTRQTYSAVSDVSAYGPKKGYLLSEGLFFIVTTEE